jgi:hypothetical protein
VLAVIALATTIVSCGPIAKGDAIRGWGGFVGSTEKPLRNAGYRSDHLESLLIHWELILKLVLFSLRGALNF